MADVGADFVALDEGIGDEGVALWAVVVAVEVVDGPGDLSVVACEAVVGDVAVPLVFAHGVVVAAGFVEAVDKVAGDDDAEDALGDVAATEIFGNRLSGKLVEDFDEAGVGLFRVGVEGGGCGGFFGEVLGVAGDEEGVAFGFSGEGGGCDGKGEKKRADHG